MAIWSGRKDWYLQISIDNKTHEEEYSVNSKNHEHKRRTGIKSRQSNISWCCNPIQCVRKRNDQGEYPKDGIDIQTKKKIVEPYNKLEDYNIVIKSEVL